MVLDKKVFTAAAIVAFSIIVTACGGDDGANGLKGEQGANGSQGYLSLVKQTPLGAGDAQCFNGGIQVDSGVDVDGNAELAANEIVSTSYLCSPTTLNSTMNFVRVSTFASCLQYDEKCNDDTETVAEISAVSGDGNTVIYTDSPNNQIGFTDISEASMPKAAGLVALDGEPTSVAVAGGYALVAVNTTPKGDYVNVAGVLDVIDIASKTSVFKIDLLGQPDSIAVSPNGKYAAVVIENERNEDLAADTTNSLDDDGYPPQAPAGELILVNLTGAPSAWTTTKVDLIGLADKFTTDPEPEYVDINSNNIAVVTLQENNYIVLVDVTNGNIVNHFTAGTVDLNNIDKTEEDRPIVIQNQSLTHVPREPDGVAWVNNQYFATADEGDLEGGSRGFTIFNTQGNVVWTSGATLDHRVAKIGHYNEGRSKNKGNEPENVEVGVFGEDRYLFVNSERSSVMFVYDIADPTHPVYKQVLPAGLGPEGVIAVPSRNLVISSSENDSRDDKFRGGLNIYSYNAVEQEYPTLVSVNRENGTPIPFSALSGLAADLWEANTVYSIEDSAFGGSRIFEINVAMKPAMLVNEIRISDANDVLAGLSAVALDDNSVDIDDATRIDVFDSADLAAMINNDKTVNIDPEGIAVASDGGFWVVSEGAGTVGDVKKPVNSVNMVLKTDAEGVISNVYTLPASLNAVQLRFGFEGVAEYSGKVYVAFQRAWNSEGFVRIGVLNPADSSWTFLRYTLDATESQAGGWVGLSDLTALGNGEFMVVERDNQSGFDAAIKRLYTFSIAGLGDGDAVTKTLVKDLLPALKSKGGLVVEKVEGAAVLANGDVIIVNDNDGVDDNSGETQLLNLGNVL